MAPIVEKTWREFYQKVLAPAGIADSSTQVIESKRVWMAAWFSCLTWMRDEVGNSGLSDDDSVELMHAAVEECMEFYKRLEAGLE
jgi:hypothetical protein